MAECPPNGRPPREHLKLARYRTTIKPHMGSQPILFRARQRVAVLQIQ